MTDKGRAPDHIIRIGDCRASIWLKISKSPTQVKLTKAYKKSPDAGESYTDYFRPNELPLIPILAQRAEAWIQEHKDPGKDDRARFARLVSEGLAAGAFTEEVLGSMAASMDLRPDDVEALVGEADREFERIKERIAGDG